MTWKELKAEVDRIVADKNLDENVDVYAIYEHERLDKVDEHVYVWVDSRRNKIIIDLP